MPSKPISLFEVIIKQEAKDTMFLAGVDLDANVPKELQNIRIRLAELFPSGVNLTSSTPLDLDEPHTREGLFESVTNKNRLNFKSLRSRDGFIVLSSDPDEVYIDVDWGKCTPTDVHDGKEGYIILRGESAPDYYFPQNGSTELIVYYNVDTQQLSYGPVSELPTGGGGGAYTAGLGLELNGSQFSLHHLGIQNLVDPGAQAFIGWNTGTQATQWYTLGNGLSIVNNELTINLPSVTGQFTPGSVIFAGINGQLHEDNLAFFWDDTNNHLGLQNDTPKAVLHVSVGAENAPNSVAGTRVPIAIFEDAQDTEQDLYITLLSGDTAVAGITFGDDDNHQSGMFGYSNQERAFSFYVEGTGPSSERVVYIDSNGLGISKGPNAPMPTQALDVYDNARFRGLIYDSANGAGSNGQVLTIVNGFPVWATVPGAGGSGTNFSITDGSNSQAVGDAEAITLAAGRGLDVLVSATRTVTYSLDAVLTDLTDISAPPGTGNFILQATNGPNYSWIATPGGGSTTLAFAVDVGTPQVMDLGDTITISGGNNITTTTAGVTDEIIINWLADIDDLSDVPSYGSSSTALVLTAQNGSLSWQPTSGGGTNFTFSSTGNGTPGSETINTGDNVEFVFGKGLAGVFGGTSTNPELELSLKNSSNFTANYLPKWDGNNNQYINSILNQNGVIVEVEGYMSVHKELTIEDGNKLRFWDANNTKQVTFKASAFMVGPAVNYTLPVADGIATQVLSTDGSGNMYWATVSGGGGGGITNAYSKLAVSGSSTNNFLVTATGEDGIEFNSTSLVSLNLVQGAGTANDVITIDWSHLKIEDLVAPVGDRIAFFDSSYSGVAWLSLGTGLSISGTTLNVSTVAQDIFDTISAGGNSLLSSASSTVNFAGANGLVATLSGSTVTLTGLINSWKNIITSKGTKGTSDEIIYTNPGFNTSLNVEAINYLQVNGANNKLQIGLADDVFNGPTQYNALDITLLGAGTPIFNNVQINLSNSGPAIVGSIYVRMHSNNAYGALTGNDEFTIQFKSPQIPTIYDIWNDGSLPEQVLGYGRVIRTKDFSGTASSDEFMVEFRRGGGSKLIRMYKVFNNPTTPSTPANGLVTCNDVGQGGIVLGQISYHSEEW